MSEALQALQRRLHTAAELKSVVRTMKTLAAISLVPFENAVRSLADYYRAVELGLIASLRQADNGGPERHFGSERTGMIVFGSDQGMVGQFNETLADFVLNELKIVPGEKTVWPIGERIAWRFQAPGIHLMPVHSVPDTVSGITPLINDVLQQVRERREEKNVDRILVFHNQPIAGKKYKPLRQQLLPFDAEWLKTLAETTWPTKMIPQIMPLESETLAAFLREWLFVCLFRACAESLASEVASRLATMQAAEHKIGELIDQLQLEFNQARQNAVDEELFDVITGYEALSGK